MWDSKYIEELKQKRLQASLGGGVVSINRQHSHGKMTARERVNVLLDENSFVEINDFVSSRASDFGMEKKRKLGDGVVTGYGMIQGRITFVASQDFTVSGGSLGEAQATKICHIMELALSVKAPIVFINDSGGARIEEGIDGLSGYSNLFYRNTMASGVIPQISVILGPCAGGACYSPAITDFIFMTTTNSQMYITGPDVVRSVTGEDVCAADLGGAHVHASISGVVHFVYDDEVACLNGVRKLLGYLPQNNEEKSIIAKSRIVDRTNDLAEIVPDNPRQVYDVKEVISSFIDEKSFFEVQEHYAQNIVIGFARLDGRAIAIVANQSKYMAGSLEINASDKAARFIRFCDCFNVPILTLVDVPAFLPGTKQEHSGIIRHGAKLLYAYSEATVPKVGLIMRKAYGGAYIAMSSKGTGCDVVYAWPIAELAVMGATGAVSVISRKEINAAEDPLKKTKELQEEYNKKFMNPYIAAEHGYIDAVILPSETRCKLVSAFMMLENKRKTLPSKKHGNIPL